MQTLKFRASSHEPGWSGWPSYWDESFQKFQPGDEKWPKILETNARAKVEKPSRHVETHQILTFAPIIASAVVSLQLNGMLMKWKIQRATHGWCHPDCQSSFRFHPCNWAELFIWQSFQPTYRDPRELSHPALSYEHIETFTEDLGLLHMSPVERAGPVTGTKFSLGFIW